MIEDCTPENGPLLVVPGSHRGPVFDHHYQGYFAGAIDPLASGLEIVKAVALTGKAGSISLHHVRAVHGSRANLSERDRPLLLFGYCAADAWPLKAESFRDIDSFNARMVRGKPTLEPRLRNVPVRMPYPPAPYQGSIFENQVLVKGRSFDRIGADQRAESG